MENKIVAELFFRRSKYDNGFNYVLFYVNQQTNYMLLRPIMSTNIHELAVELLKVFADFDVPTLLKVVPQMKQKIIETMYILEKMDLPLQLPEVESDRRRNPYGIVTSLLNDMSVNWALEVGLIQWTTNIILNTYDTKPKVNSTFNPLYTSHLKALWQIDSPEYEKYCIPSNFTRSAQKLELNAPVNLKCTKCCLPLHKTYTCHNCKKPYHFTCCYRQLLRIGEDYKILTTCVTCKLVTHLATKCSV